MLALLAGGCQGAIPLEFSTYVGGGSYDRIAAMAVDANGDVYVIGSTNSRDFGEPVLLPSEQAWFPGHSFLMKLDRDGQLVYSRVAVDGLGYVYLAGEARVSSTEHSDAVLTKLDPSGSLVFSRKLGGGADDSARALAVDPSGVVIVGYTQSHDFPVVHPLQACVSGPSPVSSDAFVAKFDATGALVYATCLGGSEIEWATHVAIRRGDVYAAGFTRSRDFPTTSGAFQPAFGGGDCGYGSPSPCNDLFVAKLDPSGSRLTYSSFFGGDNDERPGGLAVDDAGDAYIAGTTRSHNLPTARPLQRACRPAYGNADCGDAFVAKIAATGTALVYSTYLGGSGPDGADALCRRMDGIEGLPGARGLAKSVHPRGGRLRRATQPSRLGPGSRSLRRLAQRRCGGGCPGRSGRGVGRRRDRLARLPDRRRVPEHVQGSVRRVRPATAVAFPRAVSYQAGGRAKPPSPRSRSRNRSRSGHGRGRMPRATRPLRYSYRSAIRSAGVGSGS
ncbi:MAG: hypothetical protein DMF79_14390 [Acidobacteria bacterium]|nr:MAG: hypothetical protein DMF79_14390 [Acidobacteriota bacterium]